VHTGDPTFNVSCPFDCCRKAFCTFSGFNTHIYRDHRVALGLDRREAESTEFLPEAVADISEFTENEDTDPGEFLRQDLQERDIELPHVSASFESGRERQQQQKESAKFILKLREIRGISQVAVTDVVEGCQSLFQNTLVRVKEGVRDRLSHAGINYLDIEELDSAIDLPDPFEALNTIHLQDKYFKEHFNYLVSVCDRPSFDGLFHYDVCTPPQMTGLSRGYKNLGGC